MACLVFVSGLSFEVAFLHKNADFQLLLNKIELLPSYNSLPDGLAE